MSTHTNQKKFFYKILEQVNSNIYDMSNFVLKSERYMRYMCTKSRNKTQNGMTAFRNTPKRSLYALYSVEEVDIFLHHTISQSLSVVVQRL